MGDHRFNEYEDFEEDSEEESSEDIGLGAIIEAVEKKADSAHDSLNNIQEELDSYMSGLDDTAKILFVGVANMIKEECATVGTKMDSMVDAIEGIRDFVTPDQKKMHELQNELKRIRNDYAVTLQRVEEEEGAGFTQSKASIKRAENRTRRSNEIDAEKNNPNPNKHDRHYSLMDIYDTFNDNSDNSDDSSDGMEDQLVVKKLNVTMDSASYHCGVIKDVLREMIAEISGISEAEQSLCLSVSETIGGSIDRVQFALDNLYDQGLSEHESWKETRAELQELKKEFERETHNLKAQRDTMYTKLQNKGNSSNSGSEDDFMESMKSLGLRDLGAEIKSLETENSELLLAVENEREISAHARSEAKSKAAQLRKLHKDHEELTEQFEECQIQLSDAKTIIAELDLNLNDKTVDIEDYNALKEALDYARITKVTTISFLDAEIRRLKSEIYSICEGHMNASGS